MEQEGVSAATYGRGRLACCRVMAQITYGAVVFLPFYHPGNRTRQIILDDFLDPFHITLQTCNIMTCLSQFTGQLEQAEESASKE